MARCVLYCVQMSACIIIQVHYSQSVTVAVTQAACIGAQMYMYEMVHPLHVYQFHAHLNIHYVCVYTIIYSRV